jgi:hypothetical protein
MSSTMEYKLKGIPRPNNLVYSEENLIYVLQDRIQKLFIARGTEYDAAITMNVSCLLDTSTY